MQGRRRTVLVWHMMSHEGSKRSHDDEQHKFCEWGHLSKAVLFPRWQEAHNFRCALISGNTLLCLVVSTCCNSVNYFKYNSTMASTAHHMHFVLGSWQDRDCLMSDPTTSDISPMHLCLRKFKHMHENSCRQQILTTCRIAAINLCLYCATLNLLH